MDIIFPPKVRALIYVVVVLGTAVLVPLHAGNVVNDLVLNVWTSVCGAASALAALNITRSDK
jgi:hypothetical protein